MQYRLIGAEHAQADADEIAVPVRKKALASVSSRRSVSTPGCASAGQSAREERKDDANTTSELLHFSRRRS